MPAAKRKNADKRFDSFITKIGKNHKVSMSSAVKHELDQIIKFSISEVARGGAAIHNHYLKKQKTVTPATIRSSLEAFLKGALKKSALDFGDKVVMEAKASKDAKKADKAIKRISGGDAAVESAA